MQDTMPDDVEEFILSTTEHWRQMGYKLTAFKYSDDYYIVRLDHPYPGEEQEKKIIRPVSRNASGMLEMKEPKGNRPLYGQQDVIDHPDATIFVVEGEKCVDALRDQNFVAVTSGSCTSAKKADWSSLKDRHVVVWADNDKPGRKYAHNVVKILIKIGCHVELIDVDKLDLPPDGDFADWLLVHPNASSDDIQQLPRLPAQTIKSSTAIIKSFADITSKLVVWLWLNCFAIGKYSLIVGDPGVGKSTIVCYIAAHVSTGADWPDMSSCKQGSVIIISGEDDPHDTIKPRLMEAGANLDHIHFISGIKESDPDKGEDYERTFALDDIQALEEAIVELGDVRLIIIDPITAYLGKADSNNNADVRGKLLPLAELAARHDIAIIAVSHLNKSEGKASYRVMGSLAFSAAARSVFVVTKDKANPFRIFMLSLKNNLAPGSYGLAYSIVSGEIAPFIEWEPDPVYMSVEDALRPEKPEKKSTQCEMAEEWLKEILSECSTMAMDVYKQGAENGFSKSTLNRAKRDHVIIHKVGNGQGARYFWSLENVDITSHPTL